MGLGKIVINKPILNNVLKDSIFNQIIKLARTLIIITVTAESSYFAFVTGIFRLSLDYPVA